MAEPWWQRTVVYQVYPRSFADSNGDGIGDLPGLVAHLDHLVELGVGALWLSPVFRSPMADFGYDVSDYCEVDPLFGTLADLDALVAAAHGRALRVLLDWVPNHTSIAHPWFVESRSSRASPRRDFYIWRDPDDQDGPPNNWLAEFTGGGPAWSLDEATGQYYLHSFLPEQPDLNWANPEVRAAMFDVVRFWFDRGIDGLRIDVVHLLGKDLDRDDPGDAVAAGLTHVALNDVEATHAILRELRVIADGYPGDRVLVGEVFLLDPARVVRYYGADDELHLSFNFRPIFSRWRAESWRRHIDAAVGVFEPAGAWPTWVLSNHDRPRHRTRYGSEAAARAAAVLLLTLPGTPFLYAGEELGLEDATIPADRCVDPGGRDGCRAPLPWTRAPGHGWSAEPWLPFGPEPAARSVEAERADPASVLALYRQVLRLRGSSPALQTGAFAWLPVPPEVLGWERTKGSDRFEIFVNFGREEVMVAHGARRCIVASDRADLGPHSQGSEFDGVLEPHQAVVLGQ